MVHRGRAHPATVECCNGRQAWGIYHPQPSPPVCLVVMCVTVKTKKNTFRINFLLMNRYWKKKKIIIIITKQLTIIIPEIFFKWSKIKKIKKEGKKTKTINLNIHILTSSIVPVQLLIAQFLSQLSMLIRQQNQSYFLHLALTHCYNLIHIQNLQ